MNYIGVSVNCEVFVNIVRVCEMCSVCVWAAVLGSYVMLLLISASLIPFQKQLVGSILSPKYKLSVLHCQTRRSIADELLTRVLNTFCERLVFLEFLIMRCSHCSCMSSDHLLTEELSSEYDITSV